jgi:hypothetical protein
VTDFEGESDMNTRISLLGCLAVVLASMAPALHADPVQWSGNGHYYEVVDASGITWSAANDAASTRFFNGKQGHLATLTSAGENAFVDALRSAAFPSGPTEAWIGGFQDPCTSAPAEGWKWVNGEGDIPGSASTDPYANWPSYEPNDAAGPFSECYLGIWSSGLWNDEANLGNIGGYIVEYDGVVAATDCTTTAGGCNPSGVQEVVLPDTVVLIPGATLTQTLVETTPGSGLVEFADPRVNTNGECWDRRPLDVFGDGSLILPPYLCGSPQFSIVRSVASGITVPSGVIRSEQFPEEIYAEPERFECAGTPTETDLQQRGVFVWQPDDRTELIEGTALELTNGCGSSRGATKSPSFFVLNLHIDCGIPFGTNPGGVKACFRFLTLSKFAALQLSLLQARSSLNSPRYAKLLAPLVAANTAFLFAKYQKAWDQINTFISLVNGADLTYVNFNHQGNLLMRAENIRFTIEKIDPTTAPPIL